MTPLPQMREGGHMDIEKLREAAKNATQGPRRVIVGVVSVGMGRNGLFHAVTIGRHQYTVGHTDEITGDVKSEPLPNGYVRETLVNRRPPQREPHPDAAFIAACDPQTIIALLDELEAARRSHQEDGR
jgi:hypothetical protein